MDIKNNSDIPFLPISPYPFSSFLTLSNKQLNLEQDSRTDLGGIIKTVIVSLLMITVFSLCLVRSLDTHIENQDKMLCNSAKISGNREYLDKCECFYKGESITCLQR